MQTKPYDLVTENTKKKTRTGKQNINEKVQEKKCRPSNVGRILC